MVVYASKDGAVERRILIGLIVSKSVLGRISSKWDGHLFRSSVANTVASMCFDYYKKHNDAPNRDIDSVYDAWSESQQNQRWADEVGRYLEALSGEYRSEDFDLNSEHLMDIAGIFFQEVRQENLHSNMSMALQAHDVEGVDKLVGSYRKIELGAGSGISFFNDQAELQALFLDDHSEILVEYPGALGEFFGFDLARDSFVVFLGSEKSTKSFWLQDVAVEAVCQRRRVAYFEAGDLSKRQAERRLVTRVAQHPIRSSCTKEPFWPCTIQYPTKMEVEIDDLIGKKRANITSTKEMIFDKPLGLSQATEAFEKLRKKRIRSENPYFKLSVHSNSSLSIDTVKSSLDEWAQEDWLPDVVVIDYADILAPPPGARDERTAINENWQQLRKLSQDLHGLVLSATQADTHSYSQEYLTKENFSGDKRKNAHVTAMYGINRRDDEVRRGTCRLNVVDRRDGEGVNERCVYVAQCLPLARAAVLSSW